MKALFPQDFIFLQQNEDDCNHIDDEYGLPLAEQVYSGHQLEGCQYGAVLQHDMLLGRSLLLW